MRREIRRLFLDLVLQYAASPGKIDRLLSLRVPPPPLHPNSPGTAPRFGPTIKKSVSDWGWDNMEHDTELPSELRKEAALRRKQRLAPRTINDSTIPKIEMIVGRWYADEFGNRTRTVMARD
jgi:hypothetical protein